MTAMVESDWRVVNRSDQKLLAIPDDVLQHAECVVSLDISRNHFKDLSNLSLLRKFKNLTTLHLNKCGLRRLPEELFDLVKLEKLKLGGNCLATGISASIGKLQELKELDVRDCSMTDLPKELGSLQKLEKLILRANEWTKGLGASISKLQALKELDILYCSLNYLPEELWSLQKLEKLTFSFNALATGIGASIGKLQELKELHLRECDINYLPEELWSLQKLEKLTLRNNNLVKGLGASIGKLQALKELNISCCALSYLPEELWSLQKLEKLTLGGNYLATGISASICKLQELKELDISLNDMTCLPEELWSLQKLEKLSLHNNQLTRNLGASIGNLQALKELDISFCGLNYLPEELWSLQKLEKLTLVGNSLVKGLGASIGKLQALKELDISFWGLNYLPEELWSLQKLEKLTLSGNYLVTGISASIGKLQELKELDVRGCAMTYLPEELWSLQKLEKLVLSHNKLAKGLNCSISKMQELKELDMSSCELIDLPEEFWSFHKLVKLLLCDNRLCNYPTGSLSLPELRILDLKNGSSHGGNVIKELPLELKDTHLTELRLDGNPIVQPPEAIWKQGLEAMKLYMTELSSGEQKWLRVDTINMIGESEAGKSSIAQSLVKGSPVAVDPDDRTQVMQRLQANLTGSSSDCPVYINDFGGHYIYRSIIPLFLPFSGLAILAYNLMPKDWKDQKKKLKQWLLTAIAKSTKIRLVIIGTGADLVESSEDCSKLKSEIQTFASSVLNNLKSDVQENIGQLTSSLFKTTHDLFRRPLSERLDALESLERKLTDASLSCATVSCRRMSEDFRFFLELISAEVKSPEAVPARWWQVMQEILQLSTSGFPRRTMKEVQDIYRSVISSDPECKILPVILRYMANSSQIMWIENHPRLKTSIFHSPQGIVDICTKILDHRAAEKQLEQQDTERLSPEWQKATQDETSNYKRGILLESLLKKLLPQYKRQEIDELVAFMEYFDLISEVKLPEANETKGDVLRDPESIEERTFVITSNLPDEKPKDLSAFVNNDVSKICSSIHVSLSFVGRMVPLSFFATSLSAILTVVKEHCHRQVPSRQWKDGVWIKFANLLLKVEYHEEDKEVRFTARSTQSKSSPWFILYPVLKRLQENISASWPGLAPEWLIMCPGCAWLNERGLSDPVISRLQIFRKDFTSHSEEEPSGKHETEVFPECNHVVPRSLCHLMSQEKFTDEEQQEIATFYENLPAAVVEEKPASLRDDEPATKRQKTSATDAERDGEKTDLQCRLSNSRVQLVKDLDSSSIDHIIDLLKGARGGRGLISEEDSELITAEKTVKGKARRLLDAVHKRGDDAIIVLMNALSSEDVNRRDLAELLMRGEHDGKM